MGDKLPFPRLLLRLGVTEPIGHRGPERRQVKKSCNSFFLPMTGSELLNKEV